MGMMLGNRQLAMLREMGVRVWQPKAAASADAAVVESLPVSRTGRPPAVAAPAEVRVSDATKKIAAKAHINCATGTNGTDLPATQAATGAWYVGPSQELYAPAPTQFSARWLVLMEAASDALLGGFNPLEGDAGKLLDNMLRAAQLHASGGVTLAPLARGSGVAGSANAELNQALPGLVAKTRPAMVLVIGRLAAPAALQSNEPLAKLRGRVHQLHGAPCIVTLDPAYLLRNPLHKAMAWDDLCLAMGVANS
jgi:uracil-DNA glycosylase